MDVLDQLANVAVAPVPGQRSFAAGVRRKLNPRLLALHVVEFAVGETSWAVVHMAAALLAAVFDAAPQLRDRVSEFRAAAADFARAELAADG